MNGHVNLLTVAEVAAEKKCSEETVRRAVRAGAFPGARKVGSVWLLPESAVASWQPKDVGRPSATRYWVWRVFRDGSEPILLHDVRQQPGEQRSRQELTERTGRLPRRPTNQHEE